MDPRMVRRAGVLARGLAVLLLALGLHGCAQRPVVSATPAPVERPAASPIVATAGLQPRERGLVLLGELGCVACHAERARSGGELPTIEVAPGPDLRAVGARVQANYLAHFLADPLAVEAGTTMPDLLRERSDADRAAAAVALAHYLRSFAVAGPVAEPNDREASLRGREVFHSVGCVACHALRDEQGVEVPAEVPAEVPTTDSVPMAPLAEKYTVVSLRAFLQQPHEARPASRMPDLHLSPNEAHELGNYLLQKASPATAVAPVDPVQVAAGRTLFAERGCAQCHALPDAQRTPSRSGKPLHELDASRGCLSGKVGVWPFYALSAAQVEDVRAALAAIAEPLADEARIRVTLVGRRCTACHARGELGGVAPERSEYFQTSDPSIGLESRMPPTLTGVGAKLQPAWLEDTIANGQTARPYLQTRMPGFGGSCAAELAPLLSRDDVLEPLEIAPLPEDDAQARAITDLGKELVGEKGMNCITCHMFAGEKVGTMGAIDLVESTAQRLRPQWFAHFLRTPFRYKPGTLMPQFFPDGVTTRPELGGGDTTKQIEAIWHYLAQGRNVGKPRGMRRPPIELEVADEAVLLRRSVQNTGKRGISVGLPGGVNFTFDAERLGQNQIWWGGFVDASPVWTSQGSGEARILGKDRVTLPNGPCFVVLASADAPWPEASRRELGQRFLGYDLDAKQRPTFRYVCEDVEIADASVELPKPDSRPLLRRTLSLSSAKDKTLAFRAARAAEIQDLGSGRIQVGKQLQIQVPAGAVRIRSAGAERELICDIAITNGRGELVIEYSWQEGGK
jgi:mono/diheme cytochrome c family protein